MTARNKMMDYLARRDHSEKEIRQKLKKTKAFSEEQIEKAIEFGRDNGWLPDTPEKMEVLSEKTAGFLHRRKKGIQYINQFLAKKGLPPVQNSFEQELEKALELVKNKTLKLQSLPKEEKQKAKAKLGRFLVARGFDLDVVRKVIYEKL